jgi:hypothetical protein
MRVTSSSLKEHALQTMHGRETPWSTTPLTPARSFRDEDLRVRRQGLEPRTRGLRVRCSVRFFSLNCCQIMLAHAGTCHSVRSPASAARCGYRVVPDRTGHTSNHGTTMGTHRSRPLWSSASGIWRGEAIARRRQRYRCLARRNMPDATGVRWKRPTRCVIPAGSGIGVMPCR